MQSVKERGAILIATFFYIGHLPKAPGTWGSLAALPLIWYLWQLPFWFAFFLLLLCIALGIWASDYYCRLTKQHDNQKIVIDEVLGMGVASMFTPPDYVSYLLVFMLFRFFDIFKPFPIKMIDSRVKGGVGVVLDDVLAGLYVAIIFLLYAFISTGYIGVE